MKRLLVGIMLFFTISLSAQERIVLDTPILVVSDPGVAKWRVCSLTLERIPAGIKIRLCECNDTGAFIVNENGAFVGRSVSFEYGDNPTTASMLSSLNTANLSTKSLERRIIERLQVDGKLKTGTISGTP